MKVLPYGKDKVTEPCIELDNGKVISLTKALLILINKHPNWQTELESAKE